MVTDLEMAKKIVKGKIMEGPQHGINAVGEDLDERRLIVFVEDEKAAEEALGEIGGSMYQLKQFSPPPAAAAVAERGLIVFLRRLFGGARPRKGQFELGPNSTIRARPGTEGRLGCFVEYPKSDPLGVTAGHLFFQDTKSGPSSVELYVSSSSSYEDMGLLRSSGGVSAAMAVSDFDSALFEIDTSVVDLKRSSLINGSHLDSVGVNSAKARWVTNLGSSYSAMVHDVNAMASYEVRLNGSFLRAVFDGQIFVKGYDSTRIFGSPGESGSLVTMDARESNAKTAVGFYTHSPHSQYHFITPLHVAASRLGFTGIHNPPSINPLQPALLALRQLFFSDTPAGSAPDSPDRTPRS